MRTLFSEGDLRGTLEGQRRKMLAEIEAYDENRLLNTPEEELAEYFVSKYETKSLAIADRDDISVEVVPTRVDARQLPDRYVSDNAGPVLIDGTVVRIRVPVDGDPMLLRLRGSTWSFNPPYAVIDASAVVYERSWGSTPHQNEVARWVNEELARLHEYARYQHPDIEQHNAEVRREARQRVQSRRAHVLAGRNLQASLPFKMHPRADAPLTFTPKGVKKKQILAPLIGTTPFRPEPALSEDQFAQILRTLQAMGRSMERAPAAYASLGEEDLRSILLTALNAQFEGGATGETFNVSGKTDILIRHEDRNLFVAECKIWDGPRTLTGAIDQILSYLAWRDTRAAALLFMRRKDFGAAVEKVPETVAGHAQYRRALGEKGGAEWHYRFAQRADPTRELTLAVMAFHIPK